MLSVRLRKFASKIFFFRKKKEANIYETIYICTMIFVYCNDNNNFYLWLCVLDHKT